MPRQIYPRLEVISATSKSQDKSELTVGVFVHLEKAFDTANHARPLSILADIGGGNVHRFFYSYFEKHTQVVKVNLL